MDVSYGRISASLNSYCLNGLIGCAICRNSRTTGTNPQQSVLSVTSQPVASSLTGNSVEMYRII